MVLDDPVIVHSLPTSGVGCFNEYADKVFIPYLVKQLIGSCVGYIPFRESTRNKRGKGVRRKVSGSTKLPGNWTDFLHDSKNKEELFSFESRLLSMLFHLEILFTSHQESQLCASQATRCRIATMRKLTQRLLCTFHKHYKMA